MPTTAQRVRLVYDGLMAPPFLRLNDARFPPGWAMRPHEHDFIQVLYVAAGRGVHLLGGEHPIGPGDIVIVDAGLRHAWRAGRQNWLELIDFGIATGDARYRSLLVPLVESARNAPAGVIHETVPLQPQIDAIRLAVRERAAFTDFRLHGLLWQLLADIGRAARERRDRGADAAGAEELVGALERFIAAHHTRRLTLADLAAAVHVSPKHLCRIAARERGESPMRLLAACRLRRAAELLGAKDGSIAEVSAAVGLPDPRHFARMFKSAFGLTPAEYREGSDQA